MNNKNDEYPTDATNDGIQDYYKIDNKGKIRVYDINGNLASELEDSTNWYGTANDQQTLPPGYYMITTSNSEQNTLNDITVKHLHDDSTIEKRRSK